MPTVFQLVIEPPSGGRFERRIAAGSYVLGREEDSCDIPILSPDVSRRHVRLTLATDSCDVEDMGSTSGTFHEGRQIDAPTNLAYPTTLQVGTVRVQITIPAAIDSAPRSGGASLKLRSAAPNAADFSHYTPGDELGKGGMGAVLEAHDQLLGRAVAMKIILEESQDSESTRMRFIREATVLARLEHPNVVPIHEMGKDSQGRLFYTMKKVDGRTLQAILDDLRAGRQSAVKEFPLERLLTILRKVCDAMAFAHARGVIHRDLKPENIMVGAFGEALVMDWGLAKVLYDVAQTELEIRQKIESTNDHAQAGGEDMQPGEIEELTESEFRDNTELLTMDGAVMGSPQYMPPEQANGMIAELDERSDIFALGGLLYAILTLRPPLAGKTVLEVLENAKRAKIKEPTRYNPQASTASARMAPLDDSDREIPLPHCPGRQIPEALGSVSMKALARVPDERYQSVLEFSNDLEKWRGGFATSAQQISRAGDLRLLIKRHKAAAIAACLAIALLAVLIVGFKFYTRDSSTPVEQAAAQSNSEELWTDLLFSLTPEIVETTGKGWQLRNGALQSAAANYGCVPMPGQYTNTNYHLHLQLRQTNIQQGLHIVLPIGDQMTGFDLDTWSGKYTGMVAVDKKTIEELPGVLEGRQIEDTDFHDLDLIVCRDDANATITVRLDNSPLYEWTGLSTRLSQHSAWATEPGIIALGALTPNWEIRAVKVKRIAGK